MKPVKAKFKIMQLTIPKNIPLESLRHVIAHELGHAMQGRNWKKSDGMKLEKNADKWAVKWGFPRTKWMDKR
jgi:Zn-dependent peptidase ImmA (M78 family)